MFFSLLRRCLLQILMRTSKTTRHVHNKKYTLILVHVLLVLPTQFIVLFKSTPISIIVLSTAGPCATWITHTIPCPV